MIFGYFYAFLAWKIIFNFILSKLYIEFAPFGPVAQLVEHHLDMVVVDGSNPFGATIARLAKAFILLLLQGLVNSRIP